jgi:hypothetical protein
MGARRVWCAVLALALGASAVHAAPRVELGIGATTGSSDGPKRTGVALSAAALWDFGSVLELGPMLFADDLGSTTGRLRDPNNGTDLGAVSNGHRSTFGGAWRADLPLVHGERWHVQAGATWGYYRIQDDRLGIVQTALSATGWGLGAGVSRRLWPTAAIGLSVRWQQLLEDRQNHYARATVDLSWLPSAAPGSRTPRKATPRNEN